MRLSINEAIDALEVLLNHSATGLDGLTLAYMDRHDSEIVLAVAQITDAYRDWAEYREALKKMEITEEEDAE